MTNPATSRVISLLSESVALTGARTTLQPMSALSVRVDADIDAIMSLPAESTVSKTLFPLADH